MECGTYSILSMNWTNELDNGIQTTISMQCGFFLMAYTRKLDHCQVEMASAISWKMLYM